MRNMDWIDILAALAIFTFAVTAAFGLGVEDSKYKLVQAQDEVAITQAALESCEGAGP